MTDDPTPVELLNRFRELLGLTPTEVLLWRRLWLEQGKPIGREQLVLDVWGFSETTSFDETMYRLRRRLRNRGWEIESHPGPSYSLHPSERPQTEGD